MDLELLRDFLEKNPHGTWKEARDLGIVYSPTGFGKAKARLGFGKVPDKPWTPPLIKYLREHPNDESYRDYVAECKVAGQKPVSDTTYHKYRPLLQKNMGQVTIEELGGDRRPSPKNTLDRKLYEKVKFFLSVAPTGTVAQFTEITGVKVESNVFSKMRARTMKNIPILKSRSVTYSVVFALDMEGVSDQTVKVLHGFVEAMNKHMINPLQIVRYQEPKPMLEIRRVTTE